MISKTSFGIAYGVFNKRYSSHTNRLKNDGIINFPLFTENDGFTKNRWKILFKDEGLLSLFAGNPEKYHDPFSFEIAKPYGLAELSDGTLRELTKKEAEEIGLLENDFQQVFLSDEMESYLDKILP